MTAMTPVACHCLAFPNTSTSCPYFVSKPIAKKIGNV